MNNDIQLWSNLFALIKAEEKNVASSNYSDNIKSKIISSFATENKLLNLTF